MVMLVFMFMVVAVLVVMMLILIVVIMMVTLMTVRPVVVLIFIMVVLMKVMLILVVTMAVFMMVIIVLDMHIELHTFDAGFLAACAMKMISVELESLQSLFELGEFNAQVEQRAEEHVAADSTEDIEVERFHSSSPTASALIWLAA